MATSKSDSPNYSKWALLISNENYTNQENRLDSSVHNVQQLARSLETIGFRVVKCCNGTKNAMNNAIIDFSRTIKNGDLVLFFYSGHGSRVNDQNFLIAVDDGRIEKDSDFEDFAVSYDRSFMRLTESNPSHATIFILDCEKTYVTKTLSMSHRIKNIGFPEIKKSTGPFIQFACIANNPVKNAAVRNTFLTRHFLKYCTLENVLISDIFQRMKDDITKESASSVKPLVMNELHRNQQVYLNYIPEPPRLSVKDYLSDRQLTKEEKVYFDQCKDYYHMTGKPLISIPAEALDGSTQDRPSMIKLAIDEDMNGFDLHDFATKFSEIFNVSLDSFNVREVQKGSVIITLEFFGISTSKHKNSGLQLMFKSINEDLQNELGKIKTFFMFMGPEEALAKMQMHQAQIKLNPKFNQTYGPGYNFWEGALDDHRDRGGMPYYCPVGWKRWSFYVTNNFDTKFRGWCIGYHGTKFQYGLSILLNGLKPAKIKALGPGIYATPSIRYASHPRYAEVKEIPLKARKFFKSGQYIQFVLECRINPRDIVKIGCETLEVRKFRIDPNMPNEKIEWVVNHHNKNILDFNHPDSPIVCTGLMIRVTNGHPGLLSESEWWFNSHLCDKKACCALGISDQLLTSQRYSGHCCSIVYE